MRGFSVVLGGAFILSLSGSAEAQESDPAPPAAENPSDEAPSVGGLPSTFGTFRVEAPPKEPTPEGLERKAEEYTIQKGDTLWDISERFFGDPFNWPTLWSMNRFIKNPHLIYPGQVIRFIPGSRNRAPSMEVAGAGEARSLAGEPESVAAAEEIPEELPTFGRVPPPPDELDIVSRVPDAQPTIEVTEDSFLDFDEPPLGRIVSSFNSSVYLTNSDTVYIEFDQPNSVSIGDRFTIFTRLRTIRHPANWFTKTGQVVTAKGYIEIVDVQDNIFAGRIFGATSHVTRQNMIRAYRNPRQTITPKEPAKELEGYLVATKFGERFISLRDVGYIDLGKRDGVEVGDSFSVYRAQDGLTHSGRKFPKVVIGTLVAIDVREGTSTVICTQAVEAMEPGDKLMSQRARFRFLN